MKSIGLRNCLRLGSLQKDGHRRKAVYLGLRDRRNHTDAITQAARVALKYRIGDEKMNQTRMNELHMLDERRYDALFIEHRCTKLELHEPMTSVFESENARWESSLFRLDYLAVHPAGKFAPNWEGKALIGDFLKPPLLDGKISTTRSYQVLRKAFPEHTSRSVQLQISDPFFRTLSSSLMVRFLAIALPRAHVASLSASVSSGDRVFCCNRPISLVRWFRGSL